MRLHIQTLLQYDGRGKCFWVQCFDGTWDTYQEEMKTWARRVNWGVNEGNNFNIMERECHYVDLNPGQAPERETEDYMFVD